MQGIFLVFVWLLSHSEGLTEEEEIFLVISDTRLTGNGAGKRKLTRLRCTGLVRHARVVK